MAENRKTTATTKKIVAQEEEVKTNREAELETQLASMMEMIKNLQAQLGNQSTNNNAAQQPTIVVSAPTNDVEIVYLSDSLGYIGVNNLQLNCTRYGESFNVSRTDFDAIVGKYRDWFDRGILAVSAKYIDIAATKGLKTDKEYALDNKTLSKLGKMSPSQIEELWNKTPEKAHKQSIVTYFKRKFIEGDEPGFRDRAKIDVLNRLTDGGFAREAVEVSGVNVKIIPTEII